MIWESQFWNVQHGKRDNPRRIRGFCWMWSRKLKQRRLTQRGGSLFCPGKYTYNKVLFFKKNFYYSNINLTFYIKKISSFTNKCYLIKKSEVNIFRHLYASKHYSYYYLNIFLKWKIKCYSSYVWILQKIVT